jgi:shikimate kinase
LIRDMNEHPVPGALPMPSRIYLIGMMGAGKTTLGRQLAKLLGYSFLDLDKDIEIYEGRSVQQIFDEKGETYFRDAERAALERTAEHHNTVISTGGGTPCFFSNMSRINKLGFSIYLRGNAAFISGRVSKNREKRPLLRGLEPAGVELFIEKMLLQREPFYMQASRIITLPVKSVSDLVKSMLEEDFGDAGSGGKIGGSPANVDKV